MKNVLTLLLLFQLIKKILNEKYQLSNYEVTKISTKKSFFLYHLDDNTIKEDPNKNPFIFMKFSACRSQIKIL